MNTKHDPRSWNRTLPLRSGSLLLALALVLAISSQAACRERSSIDQQPQQATRPATPAPSSEPPLMLEVFLVEASRPVLSRSPEVIARAAQGELTPLLVDVPQTPSDAPLGDRLSALEEEGALTILAAYRVLTRSGQGSEAQSGYQVPIQTVEDNTIATQYINATMRISLSSQCLANGLLTVDVDLQKQMPLFERAVEGSTPIDTIDQQAKLMVRNGGTAVLSGIATAFQDGTMHPVPELILLVTATRVEL